MPAIHNPVLLSAMEAPQIGKDWLTEVDCRGRVTKPPPRPPGRSRGPANGRFVNPGGIVLELVVDAPSAGRIYRFGERLIDWRQTPIFWRVARHRGAIVTLTHAIPDDVALVGLALHAQAFITGGGRPTLTNALEAPIRR